MFDLEQGLAQWRHNLMGCRSVKRVHADELEDHLRCEIEALVGQGFSEERAFALATETMGDPDTLAAAYAQSRRRPFRTTLNRIHRMEKNIMKATRSSALMIGTSLIWAAIMIACSLVMRGAEQASDIHFILLSGWFATFFLLQPSGTATMKAEWACLKRLVSSNRRS